MLNKHVSGVTYCKILSIMNNESTTMKKRRLTLGCKRPLQLLSKKLDNLLRSSDIDLQKYLNDEKNYISINYTKFASDSKDTFDLLGGFNHKNLYKIYPHKIFCNNYIENKCVGHDQNSIFYIDVAHLSKTGSTLVNDELLKIINKIYD